MKETVGQTVIRTLVETGVHLVIISGIAAAKESP